MIRRHSPTATFVAGIGLTLLTIAAVGFLIVPADDPMYRLLGLAVAFLSTVTVSAKLYARGRETGWLYGAEDIVHDSCTGCGQEVTISLRHHAGCPTGLRFEKHDGSGARIDVTD